MENAWSKHRIRTMGSSPIKVWVSGQLSHPIGLAPTEVDDFYGVEGIIEEANYENIISERPIFDAPFIINILTDQVLEVLNREINIELSMSNNFGIDNYLHAIQILETIH